MKYYYKPYFYIFALMGWGIILVFLYWTLLFGTEERLLLLDFNEFNEFWIDFFLVHLILLSMSIILIIGIKEIKNEGNTHA